MLRKKRVRNVDVTILSKHTNETNCHTMLIKNLNKLNIRYREYTSGVDVTECDWHTLVMISQLNLPYDLLISGGGSGTFDAFCAKNVVFQQQRFDCHTSYKSKTRKNAVSIGVIDTGCLPPCVFTNTFGGFLHEEML